MVILYCLVEFQVVRFNELKRYLKTISAARFENMKFQTHIEDEIIAHLQ